MPALPEHATSGSVSAVLTAPCPVPAVRTVSRWTAEYVNPPASPPDWPSGFATTTSYVPAGAAAVVAVMLVADQTVTPVAAEGPIVTVAPAWNPLPETAIAVPPATGPHAGEMAVTDGGPTYVNPEASDAD